MTVNEYEIFELKVGLPLLRLNDPTANQFKSKTWLQPPSKVWCDHIDEKGSAILHACFGPTHAKEQPEIDNMVVLVPEEFYENHLKPTGESVPHPDKLKEEKEKK